jgi:hypothetical protein
VVAVEPEGLDRNEPHAEFLKRSALSLFGNWRADSNASVFELSHRLEHDV